MVATEIIRFTDGLITESQIWDEFVEVFEETATSAELRRKLGKMLGECTYCTTEGPDPKKRCGKCQYARYCNKT